MPLLVDEHRKLYPVTQKTLAHPPGLNVQGTMNCDTPQKLKASNKAMNQVLRVSVRMEATLGA